MKDRPELTDIVDLVERREKVGRLLLDLRRFADKLLSHAPPRDRQVFNLLVSTGFSLWRAAFLVEGNRNASLVNQHAAEFLDVLLWDNAINFPQDRRTHAFTSGYYVNNACVRLLHIRGALDLTAQDTAIFDRLTTFLDDQWHSPIGSPDVRQGWSDCHAAALLSVAKLSAKVDPDAS
jgi:hypothetical protein